MKKIELALREKIESEMRRLCSNVTGQSFDLALDNIMKIISDDYKQYVKEIESIYGDVLEDIKPDKIQQYPPIELKNLKNPE